MAEDDLSRAEVERLQRLHYGGQSDAAMLVEYDRELLVTEDGVITVTGPDGEAREVGRLRLPLAGSIVQPDDPPFLDDVGLDPALPFSLRLWYDDGGRPLR